MNPSQGTTQIHTERIRQIEKEGWSLEHDDEHKNGELAVAAIGYAAAAIKAEVKIKATTEPKCQCGARGNADCTCVMLVGEEKWVNPWPWTDTKLKIDGGPVRMLTKAGALIAAEIDRLIRQLPSPPPKEHTGDHRPWNEILKAAQDSLNGFRKERAARAANGFPDDHRIATEIARQQYELAWAENQMREELVRLKARQEWLLEHRGRFLKAFSELQSELDIANHRSGMSGK